MPTRFTVLASSSSGNASLLDVDGQAVLVDFGLGPRKLTQALELVRSSWEHIVGVLLTHVHTDHWNPNTLAHLARLRLPLWCHAEHASVLARQNEAFQVMDRDGLVHRYEAGRKVTLGPCSCLPFSVWHDTPTFGFRLEGLAEPWALGYAADLGTWASDVLERLIDVDLLALEFNHDVDMQRTSRRHESLIERVLGDHGHLSNVQAGKLVAQILQRSTPRRLRHLVQLHLSQQCNRPALAVGAADEVRQTHKADFHIVPAGPAKPTPWLDLTGERETLFAQATLPGWDA